MFGRALSSNQIIFSRINNYCQSVNDSVIGFEIIYYDIGLVIVKCSYLILVASTFLKCCVRFYRWVIYNYLRSRKKKIVSFADRKITQLGFMFSALESNFPFRKCVQCHEKNDPMCRTLKEATTCPGDVNVYRYCGVTRTTVFDKRKMIAGCVSFSFLVIDILHLMHFIFLTIIIHAFSNILLRSHFHFFIQPPSFSSPSFLSFSCF